MEDKNKRGYEVLSTMEEVYNKAQYIGKERRLIEYKKSVVTEFERRLSINVRR